ncbi:MAG: helix-turn-helix domain-containing protein [Clostridia bacterium]|nr:helix-turn-helix domain-containing protein [Clostridia bacterium]
MLSFTHWIERMMNISHKGSDIMFHKAVEMKLLEGTSMEVLFQDGKVKCFDMASLFEKYPQLKALRDREFFLSGKLMGSYGIMWNDDLDIEAETIYEEGITVRTEGVPCNMKVAEAVLSARALCGLSQKQLAAITGIDQYDISKIERGVSNPSVSTLERIAAAMGGQLSISIAVPSAD